MAQRKGVKWTPAKVRDLVGVVNAKVDKGSSITAAIKSTAKDMGESVGGATFQYYNFNKGRKRKFSTRTRTRKVSSNGTPTKSTLTHMRLRVGDITIEGNSVTFKPNILAGIIFDEEAGTVTVTTA